MVEVLECSMNAQTSSSLDWVYALSGFVQMYLEHQFNQLSDVTITDAVPF